MEQLAPGSVLHGKYRLHTVLGEGGFATVYDAEDIESGQRRAIKLLKWEDDGTYRADTRARFKRETRVLARLKGPYTVRLHEHGETDSGLLYLAFERLGGEDLSEIISKGQLDTDEILRLVSQILEALREAHEAGLLHRDIKPQNIRIIDGTAKLLDFGLARPYDDGHPSVTKTGELIGTPRYMSPEQLLGRPLSAGSDLYSLGMVLLELLIGSGNLPSNSWGDQLDRLRSGHVFSVPLIEQVDANLRRIVAKMTARDVEERYSSARAVLADLREIGLAPAATVSGLTVSPRTPRTPGRNYTLLLLAVLTVALAVALIWPSLKSDPVPRLPRARVNPLAPTAPPPLLPAPALSVDAASPSLPVEGCGQVPKFEGLDRIRDFDFDAGVLTYIPRDYDPTHAHPVVILLHQSHERPKVLFEATGFGEIADDNGVIVIVPESKRTSPLWDGRPWDSRSDGQIPKIRATLELVKSAVCVDERRVYVVSQGQSGKFAARLACEPWVTALATNSSRHIPGKPICSDPVPRPHLMLSGKADRVYLFEGGPACGAASEPKPSVAAMEELWRTNNGCEATRQQVISEPNGVCFEYVGCEADLATCHLEGGHGWPGTTPRSSCDGTPVDFPTTQTVWGFLSRFQLPDEPQSATNGDL